MTDSEYIYLCCVKIVFITWNGQYFRIRVIIKEDNPYRKHYEKHIRMQAIAICNLLLYFVAIVPTTFSPLQIFELVHHLNFGIDLFIDRIIL